MGEKANATWSPPRPRSSDELVLRSQSQGCARLILILGLVIFVTRWLVFHFTNRIKVMINLTPRISATLKPSWCSSATVTSCPSSFFSCVSNHCVRVWVGVMMVEGVLFPCAVDNCARRHVPFSGQANHGSSSTARRPSSTLSSHVSEADAVASVVLMVQEQPAKDPCCYVAKPSGLCWVILFASMLHEQSHKVILKCGMAVCF